MIGSVFLETLKTAWKQMLYWGIGLAAMALLVVVMVAALQHAGYAQAAGEFPRRLSWR